MPETFELVPRGPYDLAYQRAHFGGWPPFAPEPDAVCLAFPVEGWEHAAAVVVRQLPSGVVSGEVHGVPAEVERRAWDQAMAVLSLDVDGSAFPAVGDRDPTAGRLGAEHGWMRPVLFHSPYEAACNFVIGQRISVVQARAIRERMAVESGAVIDVDGDPRHSFPDPRTLLRLTEVRGLAAEKLVRLHGIARAALDGVLDRARLRALAPADALTELATLRGVGPFTSQGVLYRGAGLVDDVPDDAVTREAVAQLYALDHVPGREELLAVAQRWRPFRMWTLVLLHVRVRREGRRTPRRAL